MHSVSNYINHRRIKLIPFLSVFEHSFRYVTLFLAPELTEFKRARKQSCFSHTRTHRTHICFQTHTLYFHARTHPAPSFIGGFDGF